MRRLENIVCFGILIHIMYSGSYRNGLLTVLRVYCQLIPWPSRDKRSVSRFFMSKLYSMAEGSPKGLAAVNYTELH